MSAIENISTSSIGGGAGASGLGAGLVLAGSVAGLPLAGAAFVAEGPT